MEAKLQASPKQNQNSSDAEIQKLKHQLEQAKIAVPTIEKQNATSLPITLDSLNSARVELMLKLQALNIPFKEMPQSILGNKTSNEKVTLYELKHALLRPPINLAKPHCKMLATYLLQADEKTPYVFDKFMRKRLNEIESKLYNLVGQYFVFDATSDEKIKKEVIQKLAPFASQLPQAFNQFINDNHTLVDTLKLCLQSLKIELKQEHLQYLQFTLYKAGKSIFAKSCEAITKMLEEEKMPQSNPSEKSEKKNEYEEEAFEVDDNTNKIVKGIEDSKQNVASSAENENAPKPTHSAPPMDMQDGAQMEMQAENPDELTNTNDRMLIELAQKAFMKISEAIASKNVSVRDFLSKYIESKEIGKETVEIVKANDFTKGLKDLGIELEEQELECIIRVLCVNEENSDFLKIDDFEQIINEYRNPEEDEKDDGKDINEVSLVILLVLSNYLSKNNVSLKEFVDPYINIQPIRLENGTDKEVEVLKSEDFVTIIDSLGISMDPSELSNLMKMLAISEDHQNILKLSKLARMLSQFEASEEMKSIAKQCYDQIIRDQEGDKEEDNQAREEEMNPNDQNQEPAPKPEDAPKDDNEANYEEPIDQDEQRDENDEKINEGADYNADQDQFEKNEEDDDALNKTH